MAQSIGEFLIRVFGGNKEIALLFASFVPLIELKGAIPLGMSSAFGFPLLKSAGISYLGSTFICIPVFFLLIPIFKLLKKIKFIKKLIEKIEAIFQNKAQKISAKAKGKPTSAKKIMMWSLFIFVAVPFPVTGIWTGTAIAVFLGLKFRESILPLALGNLVAGIIITLLTWLFKDHVDKIIYVLFGIAIIMLIVFIVKVVRSKPKSENAVEQEQSQEENKTQE